MTFYKEVCLKETSVDRIPEDWGIAKLGDVTLDHKQGFYTNQSYSSSGIRLVRITDLLNPEVSYETMPFLNVDDKTIEQFKVNVGDFLIARSGAIGRYGIVTKDVPCIFGSYIIRFRFNTSRVDNYFLGQLFQSTYVNRQLLSKKHGATNININAENIKSVKIPLPPIDEQRRIVGVLGIVDSAIGLVDRVIWKTERLKKGLMQKLLTKGMGHKEYKDTPIGKIPKEWEVTNIDEECLVGTGGTPSRSNPQYFGGNVFWVKSTEVNYNIITKTEETLTESGMQNSNAKMHPKGSLIVALYGQGITRGKCAILGIDAAINQACAAIQSKGRIYIPYLFYWFQNSYTHIRRLSQGANQANLNMEIIRSLKIPLLSIPEQQKMVEILSTLDEKLELETKEKARLEKIKVGLMDLLLTGKIRVKVD